MNQYQETFKRYEIKYLIDETKFKKLSQRLQDKLTVDQYGKTTICNIYFDTPDHLLIRTSLEKPVYKEKLRLRSYGTPSEGDTVFVELKKKYKGVVYKRREKMEISMAEHFLYDQIAPCRSSQIMNEINWFINSYQDLIPSMYISYNRIAMYGLEDSKLRITFDSNILWREEELWLGCGTWGNSILEEGQRLMEIKISGSMPIWLSRLLSEMEIYPVTFSKYGKGYQQSLQQKKSQNRKGEKIYA
jgi:hypothetical protein